MKQYPVQDSVQALRQEIDQVDHQLVRQLLLRSALADQLVALKAAHRLSVEDLQREHDIVRAATLQCQTERQMALVEDVYAAIFAHSKAGA